MTRVLASRLFYFVYVKWHLHVYSFEFELALMTMVDCIALHATMRLRLIGRLELHSIGLNLEWSES